MDDWDAFDPDLHAAITASITPPETQPQTVTDTRPTGSDVTVQSAQQVHTQSQVQAGTSGETYREPTIYGRPLSSVFPSGHAGPTQTTGTPQFPSVHQAQPPPTVNTGGTVDSTSGSDVTFRPAGAGGSSSGPNGGGMSPPPFPAFHAGSQS